MADLGDILMGNSTAREPYDYKDNPDVRGSLPKGQIKYSSGYGYGQNKGTWKTYDDGKTWEYVADKKMEQVSIGSTTVSKTEDGIYCNGIRIFEEPDYNIYGFDKKFYLTKGNTLYSSSDGKTYEEELIGDFAEFDDALGIYTGEDGIYDLKTKEYSSNKTLIVDGTENEERINILLLYALNKIFLPEIAFKATGNTRLKEGEYYLDDPRQQKFAIDEDRVYQYSEFSSLINWKEDVGMFPFEGIGFADLMSNEVKKIGDKTFVLVTDEKLKEAINHVISFYEARKNEILFYAGEKIKAIEPDKKYIEEITAAEYVDEQERINALETYSEYVLGAKGGSIEILYKFLEAIHYLDDYKAKMVINAAIYESAMELAPKLRGRIYDTSILARKLGHKLEVELKDITWDYEKALWTVYIKYQKYISNNIMRFNDAGDKSIIRIAALNYRTEIKQQLLDELNEKLLNINLYDDLRRHYADKVNELNNYLNGTTTNIPNLEIPDFEEYYLDMLHLNIIYIVNEFDPIFFDNDGNYLELNEDERKRAMKYAKEIFSMFKNRICDYYIYMRKKGALHFLPNNVIKSDFENWKNNGGIRPNWESELKRLDVLARDSVVYKFISEEVRI